MLPPPLDNGLKEPWKNLNRALVLDGYYLNDFDFPKIRQDPRVAGIIHRATGPRKSEIAPTKLVVKADENYDARKSAAKANGFLWGSFHVGMSKAIMPVREQARLYLDTAKPADDEVIALDLEDFSALLNEKDPSSFKYMQPHDAADFITYIRSETGRYPLLYVTGFNRNEIVRIFKAVPNNVFTKTPLWYVWVRTTDVSDRFPVTPDVSDRFPVTLDQWWKTYTLWQFASELNCCPVVDEKRRCDLAPSPTCPFEKKPPEMRVPKVPGVWWDMDVNIYNGTVEEIRREWPFTYREPAP